ncbi:hypothetical protein Fcan01_01171 [Folsomia candida]|uniref:Ionotropic glutamate receptor C-terminal domain-containing protein n=2 Tax=Folsomia candida TaxID=158441 RepID=A0A226F1E2_FOLCA|nr:hypothetical protein Fcan01_01171 [Folsomia candida]
MSPHIPNLLGAPTILSTHHLFTQTLIESVLNLRSADFYGFTGPMVERNHTLPGIAKIAAEFSKICNFTPVVVDLQEFETNGIDLTKYRGAVVPFVVQNIITATQNCCQTVTNTTVSLSFYHKFNFAYCDFNREIIPNDLSLLLYPFDPKTWMYLLLLSVLLAFYFLIADRKEVSKFESIYTIFAAYLLFYWPSRGTQKSKLIVLWFMACIVLNTIYSGVLTSLLVAPLQLDVIKNVEELADRKYNLTFANVGHFSYIILLVGNLFKSQEAAELLKPKHSNVTPTSSPGLTLSTAILQPTLHEFIETLSTTPATATFGPWEYSSYIWTMVQARNEAMNKKTKKKSKLRTCHIGRELSSKNANPTFWIFKFPQQIESDSFAYAFNVMHASGIHDYWMNTFFWMQACKRAQDVNKYKTISEVVSSVGGEVWPLGFDKGSVSVVFRLYVVCIFLCVLVFLLECAKRKFGIHFREMLCCYAYLKMG